MKKHEADMQSHRKQSQKSKKTTRHKNSASQSVEDTDTKKLDATEDEAANTNEAQTPSQSPTPKSDTSNGKMVWFTGIIAAATVVYVVCAWQQMSLMKSQLSQMQRDSQSSSDASQKQLDIMQEQLSHIQEASHLEQRAWIGVFDATHETIEPNKPVRGRFIFKNTGSTPATIITMGHSTRLKPKDFDVEAFAITQEEAVWKQEEPIQKCLAPNASMSWSFSTNEDYPIPKELVESIQSGELQLYVIGRIVYSDTFGVEHQTK